MSQAGAIDFEGNNPQVPTEFETDDGSAIPIDNMLEILGTSVPAGSIPVETTGSGNTVTIEVQTSQAIAATNADNIGLAAFDSSQFTVDANGFVQLIGGGMAIDEVLTANATPQFVQVGSTATVDFDLSNLVLGTDLPALTSGAQNVGMGQTVFGDLTSGNGNTAVGFRAGTDLTTGSSNTLIGQGAGTALETGIQNTFIGSSTGSSVVTGSGNIGIGHNALTTLINGSNNICMAVTNSTGGLSGSKSNNIIIGATGTNVTSNGIHVGHVAAGLGQHTHAYMAGITGVTVAASAPVGVDTNGQLSSLGFGTAGDVLTSNGAGNSPTYQTPTAGTVTSVSGTADRITSTGGATPVIDIAGTYVGQTSLTTLGTVATGTWEATDVGVAHGGTGVSTITGLVSGNGTNAFVGRTITGTADQIDVANGDGSTANPTLSLPSTIQVGGISFDSGTNTLSEYEEGSWTPALIGSTTNPSVTYNFRAGSYTRIGNQVFIKMQVNIATISGGSGFARISGLPFTSNNDASTVRGVMGTSGVTWPATAQSSEFSIQPNTSFAGLVGAVDGGADVGFAVSDVTANDQIFGEIFYRI